ncbi:MAG: AAA family ATPase [Kiloniellales bacterium]
MAVAPLAPDRLIARCDPQALSFADTTELTPLEGALGQSRALEAIRFAADMGHSGYNLFVMGPPGSGKRSTLERLLRERAARDPAPRDWIYVNTFDQPNAPTAIGLPPGRGGSLRDAMHRLIEDLRVAIPAAFESEDTQNRRQAIEEEVREHQETAFDGLRKRAEGRGIALVRTPSGFGLAPLKDGHVITPEEFQKLPEDEQTRIKSDSEDLQNDLEEIVKQLPKWDKERRSALRQLNEEVTAFAVGQPIAELRQAFADLPEVTAHLEAVQADLVENFHRIFFAERAAQQQHGAAEVTTPAAAGANDVGGFNRYEVNLLVGQGVDSKGAESAGNGREDSQAFGAPVIYEDNPTLGNLVGRIEHIAQMGALVTDFSLIRPGALHRANGGYLILDADKLLTQPFAWEALKRALKARHIAIESALQMMSMGSTMALEPEPVPLRVKVALLGDPLIYYLLSTYDRQFPAMFKVAADFDDRLLRDPEGETRFARLIATMVAREELRPVTAEGVARVIEQAARLAQDGAKLSLLLEPVLDLLREADWQAGQAGVPKIAAAQVQAAIDARVRRADRMRERAQEAIARDILLIEAEGEEVGQINGLAVLQLGDFAFGKPSRLTARVRLGGGRVIDIEREAKLGGALHTKGVLILAGFLAGTFVRDLPLSISATLVFEQSYGGVDGDSASSAELYALLSALAEVPLRQDLAVTGSVNQYGQVQAIGGVNEKIEGFYDTCAAKGLTGTQGVLIPAANVQHLMLRHDVIEAAAAGRFAVYPISNIAEGIELLTGLPAGARDAGGRFPDGSLFAKVEARLRSFAEARRDFGRDKEGDSADGRETEGE